MPKIVYTPKRFGAAALDVIQKANEICATYAQQGFNLTLRQLYYQFVARALIPNKDREYKRLGSIITDARRAGELDWDYIVDRTRNVAGGDGSDTDPSEVIDPYYFSAAMWEGQPRRVEVWVEKDALVDIVGQAARPLRVAYFSCRGYTSDSEIWKAAQRLEGYFEDDDAVQGVTILHLGDHDPSGIDMTRDITDRLDLFLTGDGYWGASQSPEAIPPSASGTVEIHRIALNMDQVVQYDPPPNPAKVTDSRFEGYVRIHGEESWELDALEPGVLRDLIQSNIRSLLDAEKWVGRREYEAGKRATLTAIKDNYDQVIEFLNERGLLPEVAVEDEE